MQVNTGIFWCYGDRIVALDALRDVQEADSTGWLDCPWQHASHWFNALTDAGLASELMHVEYDQLLRGRLLYSVSEGRHVVYSDMTVLSGVQKESIRERFGLEVSRLIFRHDAHYTIDQNARFHLLDD